MSSHLSEYKEAQDRFQKLKIKINNIHSDPSNDENHYFDDVIENLCRKGNTIDVGSDSTLFYELIIYSDFIQIKTDMLEIFYSELCNTFILSHLIEDIVENFGLLEDVHHVKKYLAWGLLKIFQLKAVVINNSLLLSYSKEKIWHRVNLDKINIVTILPSAYKIMLSNAEFKFCHLNFLFRILEVKKLNLSRCNLNGRNVEKLFEGLELDFLNLSECGTSVNQIIQNNISGILNSLKGLDLSNNPIFNETLEKIRWLPLNYLNISNCIKSTGKFINSIWFADYFASLLKYEGYEAKGNMDILWEVGILRGTIEVLNVSSNDLSKKNLQIILQSQLKELDVTGSLKSNSIDFSDVIFPKSLQTLKAKNNEFFFDHFKVLCETSLEKLEIDYYEADNDNFSDLSNSSLTKTLKDLRLCVRQPSDKFISFISNIKLHSFHCGGKYIDSNNENIVNAFISNHQLERKCLQVLKIEGPSFEILNRHQFFSEFRKLNLKELSIYCTPSREQMNSFLSCENLHESIESLELTEHYVVNDDDLLQIPKFKKLVRLSFSYSGDIRDENLKGVVEIRTLKELKVTAIIKGSLDLNLARLICIVPTTMLRVYRGGDVTDEAFKYLMKPENAALFSEHLVSIISVGSHFVTNMSKIFKNVNWEEILLIECTWPDNSSDIMLSNENVIHSLENLSTSVHVNKCWNPKYLHKMKLSKLKSGNSKFDDSIQGLEAIPISEFLFSISLGKFRRDKDIEYLYGLLQTNLSVVDEYNWSTFRCK